MTTIGIAQQRALQDMQDGGVRTQLARQSRFAKSKIPRRFSMTAAPAAAVKNVPRPRAMPFQPRGPICPNPSNDAADDFLLAKIQHRCGADNTECIERLSAAYQRQIQPSRETYCFGASATIATTLRL